jgi:hypothetical protein
MNWRRPHIAPARRARVRNTLFTDLIQHPAAHLTPLERTLEFRNTCFSGPYSTFPCSCFYRTRKTRRVRDLCLVFWAPSWGSLIHIKRCVGYYDRTKFTTAEIANFVKSWQNSKAARRNFNPGPFTVQLSTNEFWYKLGSLLAKFCKAGCNSTRVLSVFLNYCRPGLLFADFADAKTLVL